MDGDRLSGGHMDDTCRTNEAREDRPKTTAYRAASLRIKPLQATNGTAQPFGVRFQYDRVKIA